MICLCRWCVALHWPQIMCMQIHLMGSHWIKSNHTSLHSNQQFVIVVVGSAAAAGIHDVRNYVLKCHLYACINILLNEINWIPLTICTYVSIATRMQFPSFFSFLQILLMKSDTKSAAYTQSLLSSTFFILKSDGFTILYIIHLSMRHQRIYVFGPYTKN